MAFRWVVYSCLQPTLYQGALISLPLLLCALLLRALVKWAHLNHLFLNTLASFLGVTVLWWFYSNGVVYFLVLCVLVYGILLLARKHRGAIVSVVSVLFLLFCEMVIATATDWHQVRGSFLVMVMKMVSLSFDLDSRRGRDGEKRPPQLAKLPSFIDYTSYCLFPTTTIFGPFVTYSEHQKFLSPTPLSFSWLLNIVKAWLYAMVCLALSVCVMPFLFHEPLWNRWLAAYSAAASFRYSHYFVSFLSQFGTLATGIGYVTHPHKDGGRYSWSDFNVVHPLAIELPRSLGIVVTNWNLPMHLFLKEYVFKPSRSYVGKFGAILLTYLASALLHGLNFQLAAVLLSIGIYAYIENVLRYKLSVRLNACVLDRACSQPCKHELKKNVPWVIMVNAGFTFLAIFHLAYLGLMFGSQSEEEATLEIQGYSMFHTLRKWSHLNFLSHWVALLSYMISLVL